MSNINKSYPLSFSVPYRNTKNKKKKQTHNLNDTKP